MSVLKVKDPTTGQWEEIQSIQGPPGQLEGALSLGIDQDGLAYVYYNGVRQGTGIAVGGGSTTVHRVSNNLVHVETNNKLSAIQDGLTYRATFTPEKGYGNTTVNVTMGGVEVPNAYDQNTGSITVTDVHDDLVITAAASLLPIDLLDVTWADHAISVGQSTNSYNAWSPHNMQYDDVHDKWLILQMHCNRHLNHTCTNWTLSVFNPYDPTDVQNVQLPRVFNGFGMLHIENGVWWLMCRGARDVYKSSDGGQTWEHFTADSTIPTLFGVYKLGNRYFAGNDTNTEITYFVSDDLINWTKISFDSSLGYDILCETTFCEYRGRYWAFNRTNNSELGHPVILVSDDQGETWQLFSDQLLHGWRSTVSCLPFKNYIIIADIDRDNGYIYYSKFDGEVVEQIKSWRTPACGDDFHNINLATNYRDTIVLEFMHGLPYYRDSGAFYADQAACDNVMLVGSTLPLPSVNMTVLKSGQAVVDWLNEHCTTGLRSGTEYQWRYYLNNAYLQTLVEGVWTDISDSAFVDEIEVPRNAVKYAGAGNTFWLKDGANCFKPWHNNVTAPNLGYQDGQQSKIGFLDIYGSRYVFGIMRTTDLLILIKEPYNYTTTAPTANDNYNAITGQDWQEELPERKVISVARNKTGNFVIQANVNGWQYAILDYIPAEVE